MSTSSSPAEAYQGSEPSSSNWWQYLTVLALVAMELCWIVPWYRTVIQVSYVASPLRATLVLGAIMLLSFLIAQGIENFRLLPTAQMIILGTLFALSLILGARILLNRPALTVVNGLVQLDPGGILVVFAVLWLWWRGVTLAREPVRTTTVWSRFILGLLLLVAYVFTITRMSRTRPNPEPNEGAELLLFVLFLFSGMIAMVLARVSLVGIIQGVRKNPFDRRWLGVTSVSLALTVGITAILGGLLTGQWRLVLDFVAESIKFLISSIIFLIGLPFVYLGYLLGPLIVFLRDLLRQGTPAAATPGLTPEGPSLVTPQLLPPQDLAPTPLVVQLVIFWGFVLVMLVLLFGRVRLRIAATRKQIDPPESLLKKGEARKLLRKAVQDAAQRLMTRLRPVQRHRAAERIRQIYAELLEVGASVLRPHLENQTPLEFLPVLTDQLPRVNDELELITHAYNQVRYGEYPETQEQVVQIEAAWQRVQAEGERMAKVVHQAELAQEVLDEKNRPEKPEDPTDSYV